MATSRFTLRQLDIFTAVMAHRQIRGAAEALNMSQAAVSQALRELATALDADLFRHRGRNIEPTRIAHRLLALSATPHQALQNLPNRLHGRQSDGLEGPLHLAASSTIARYILPAALAGMSRQYPGLQLTLSSGNSATVSARVADGEADLGFIEGPARRHDVTARRWRNDQLEIIGPPDAPCHITTRALHDWSWVVREAGSGTRQVFEQALALAGLSPPNTTIEVDDSSAQVQMVAAGGGLACVSRAAADQARDAGEVRFIGFEAMSFERPLWVIVSREHESRELTDHILALLEPATLSCQ